MDLKRFLLLLTLLVFGANVSAAQNTNSTKEQVQDHAQRAQTALRENDLETATKELHAILAIDPSNADAHMNLGVLAFAKNDCSAASTELHRALATQPSLIKAKALLGICARRLGDKSAQNLLETAFSQLKDARLRTQVGMELIGLYEEQDEPDRSAPVLRSLIDLNPENVDVLYVAQRIYAELADDTLNKLAVIAPGSARMQQVIAERLINDGNYSDAIEHYKKALEIDPTLPGVRYEWAEAILESSPADTNAQNQAEQELNAILKIEGDSSRIECLLGRIANLRGDAQNAYVHYRRAFQLTPNDVNAQIGLGRTLMTLEKPEEAVRYLRMAVESDPLNSEAHYRLGVVCKRLQQNEEAAKEMRLFQEIKQTKDQVKNLYRQMNKQPKPEADLPPETQQD